MRGWRVWWWGGSIRLNDGEISHGLVCEKGGYLGGELAEFFGLRSGKGVEGGMSEIEAAELLKRLEGSEEKRSYFQLQGRRREGRHEPTGDVCMSNRKMSRSEEGEG